MMHAYSNASNTPIPQSLNLPQLPNHLQYQAELAVAQLQEFYQTVRDKCFKACVTKPSTSLSSSEQQCMAKCCDRYAEATEIVSKAVIDMSMNE